MKNCPICGTPLKETTWNRWCCPNHGIIVEDDEVEEIDKERSYIG